MYNYANHFLNIFSAQSTVIYRRVYFYAFIILCITRGCDKLKNCNILFQHPVALLYYFTHLFPPDMHLYLQFNNVTL
jgi:hypothetical protein